MMPSHVLERSWYCAYLKKGCIVIIASSTEGIIDVVKQNNFSAHYRCQMQISSPIYIALFSRLV